ncbi:hypothetical protein SOVF_172530, partial [Spinacia oleracea]
MARGDTYSLGVPVLASIYHGLNVISRSSRPSYSGSCFPTHYVYGWLGHYFSTHHAVEPPPPGPLMVLFSGAKSSKCFTDVQARDLIHGGEQAKVGCTILNKNKNELLFDDGKLELLQFSYLVSLRSCYLPLRCVDSFYIEPYAPYRFARQFGFGQGIPTVFHRGIADRKVTSYEALRFWKMLLYVGSQSRVWAPSYSLDWRYLVTPKFEEWWSRVTVNDLRKSVSLLCSSVEPDPSKPKKGALPSEGADDSRSGPTSKRSIDAFSQDHKSSSDAESDIN